MKSMFFSKTQMGNNGLRLDASFHLSDGASTRRALARIPYRRIPIGQTLSRSFYGGRDKRVYVNSPDHGIPFLGGSTMLKADLSGVKLISKKKTPNIENTILDSGWILVSRSGTVGKCVFSCGIHKGFAASEHVIRLVPNGTMPAGVIYSFLASKYGYALMTQGMFGSVIQEVEPEYIESLEIPVFPEELQKKVHALITESAKLREEADADLKKAISYFDNQMPQVSKRFIGSISKSQIVNHYHRLDSQYQLGIREMDSIHKTCQYEQIKISDLAQRIFVGDRGKRMYSARGIPFISSSDMMLFNAGRTAKTISKNNPGLESLIVHENDILISRSGTVGNVVIVGRDLAETAISEHALRLVIDKNKISPLYVFVFLKSSIAQFRMNFSAYGSVIITLNETMIGDIRVPILPQEQKDHIIELSGYYKDKLSEAAEKENEAIRLIEEEIEKWQK